MIKVGKILGIRRIFFDFFDFGWGFFLRDFLGALGALGATRSTRTFWGDGGDWGLVGAGVSQLL